MKNEFKDAEFCVSPIGRLKSCPFCKSKAAVIRSFKRRIWWVGCINKNCSINPVTLKSKTMKTAIKHWNYRDKLPVKVF